MMNNVQSLTMKKFYVLLLLFIPFSVFAQYTETFIIPDRGVLPPGCIGPALSSCSNTDFSDVNWTLSGNFEGVDSEALFTKSGGYLHFEDVDNEVCWEAPTLDISIGAAVSLKASFTIPSGSWETLTFPGTADYMDLEYSIDGGAYTRVDNVNGCPGSGHTISVSSCPFPLNGPMSFTPMASGIIGNTLDVRVCVDVNTSSDDGWLEEVCVPQAGVSLIVLPVELIHFEANMNDGKEVKLIWQTASELNNMGFEIERSSDGIRWESIGFETGHGTTNDLQSYSFMDNRPMIGYNYYRLKQLDFDGKYEYSPIQVVLLEAKTGQNLEIYPNPNDGKFRLTLHNPQKEKANIQIYGSKGNLIWEKQFRDEEIGVFWDNDFDLADGEMYFVVCQIGKEVEAKKILTINPR